MSSISNVCTEPPFPNIPTIIIIEYFKAAAIQEGAQLAQSVELGTFNPRVVGSSPTLGLNFGVQQMTIFPLHHNFYPATCVQFQNQSQSLQQVLAVSVHQVAKACNSAR